MFWAVIVVRNTQTCDMSTKTNSNRMFGRHANWAYVTMTHYTVYMHVSRHFIISHKAVA